ncbi:hypothetical protein D8674_034621 [Pyrus ussuriensis x Pyrus communis]|uniref:Uncharacterized protein n=1 Tax=Pyrus ussuriensis x Pyrus communis TaxID=2448454 RepID=A0A5N5GA38_9ROSA|nr:hypothetical protein D8674_034621 [Pyrus ussuriensis x Pyrus communis]
MAGSSVLDGGDGVMVVATAVMLSKRRESSHGGAVIRCNSGEAGWVMSSRFEKTMEIGVSD